MQKKSEKINVKSENSLKQKANKTKKEKNAEFSKRQQQQQSKSLYQQCGLFIANARNRKLSIIFAGRFVSDGAANLLKTLHPPQSRI